MNTSLVSAFMKWKRGWEHLEALARAATAYRQSRPFRVVQDRDPDTREHRTYAVPTADPSPEIALLAGDAAHNLRASLDHAVFGLSEATLGRVLTEDEQRRPEFPLLGVREKWTSALASKLTWLRPDAVSVVLEAQPFRFIAPGEDRAAVKYDPLFLLAELDKVDKHRVLPVVLGFTQISGVGVSDRVTDRHRFTHAIVDGGSYVSRLPSDLDPSVDANPYWEVHLNVRLPGWPEIEDVDASLTAAARRVEYVLGRLEHVVEAGVSHG